jgi:hypothetical protein
MRLTRCIYMSVVLPFQLMIKLADFHKNWYELHATEGHPNAVLSSYLE